MTHLLKHKSWHVYNEKNRERVRRDEQEEAEKEDRERERAILAVGADVRCHRLGTDSDPSRPRLGQSKTTCGVEGQERHGGRKQRP